MDYAKRHTAIGLVYLCLGMVLGLIMGFSMNTELVVVHAHWLLIGGVLTLFYGLIFRAWSLNRARLAPAQFWVHHLSTAVVAAGSPLFYGTNITHAITGPLVGVASAGVLAGTVLMTLLLIQSSED